VLYFQVSLFGTSELENLKYNNTIYSFYQEILKFLYKFNFFKLNYTLEKKIKKIQNKVYNN
jgi:hypothetical protein